ncbi:hypothetical protein PFICI_07587 [Pestalotiopsis fici W106-1]|uniref:Uncharacterized protein n=1 Tax=Pestalotiopsis fici (strain W106-1 / CGMCC3.15140) TaxID=1229662 RepID=W3X1P5_PESFW|nr:uncharacterized protein PFICI_07587 [Pestalotiopsis fici W106-1]ETS80058.1 hypothetical protein PFICI_07587 [Pestalotiopsis fici W106-1]
MRPSPIEEALKNAAGATAEDGEVKTEAEEDLIESIVKVKNDIEGWQELWVMMLHIFQSTPYDLFTWGLRESDEGEKQVLYKCLCHLLPHPLWEGE